MSLSKQSWLLILSIVMCAAMVARADDRTSNRPTNKTASTSTSQGDQLVVRFKVSPVVDSQVVRLGNLIDVVSWGSRVKEDVLEMPLGPAPQVGNQQDWTADDLLRNLELRGIDKKKVAWQGPESVRLIRKREVEAPKKAASTTDSKNLAPAFLSDRLIAQAEANLVQATREYLWLQTNERTQWRIDLKVPAELANTLSQKRNILSLGGGAEHWWGGNAWST